MHIIEVINSYIWGMPLILLVLIIGIYFTVRLNFLQVRYFFKAIKLTFAKGDKNTGSISSFGALCSSLAATIGTGSIVGVATAIAAGGIGTIFWMSVAAFVGMAVKYAECLLGVKYRRINKKGEVVGGPFYYIRDGLPKRYKILAIIFAISGATSAVFGIGTMVQASSIKDAVIILNGNGNNTVILSVITGIVITSLAAFIILGGIKRISVFAQMLIPFFTVVYILGCFYVIAVNINKLPAAFLTIIKEAFTLKSALFGATGYTLILSMRYGVARGIFSNEAGLGSEPITAATAKTDSPVKQGLVSMIGVFIDTILICNLTGIVIVVTGADFTISNSVEIVCSAFRSQIYSGESFVIYGLIVFAFTSIIGWSYYGERCFLYLTNERYINVYRVTYILFIFIGTIFTSKFIWGLADIFNGLMAFPNLIAVILLSDVVVNETKKHIKFI